MQIYQFLMILFFFFTNRLKNSKLKSNKIFKTTADQYNNKNKILAKINLLEEHNQNLAKLKIVVLTLFQIYLVKI